jgi:hypothetical protein
MCYACTGTNSSPIIVRMESSFELLGQDRSGQDKNRSGPKSVCLTPDTRDNVGWRPAHPPIGWESEEIFLSSTCKIQSILSVITMP